MAQEPTQRDIQLGCNYANACTESIQNIKKGVSRATLCVTEVEGMTVPFGQCWAVFDTKMSHYSKTPTDALWLRGE